MRIDKIVTGVKNRYVELFGDSYRSSVNDQKRFWKMMETSHGIIPEKTYDGYVTEFEVVDEQKYLLFILKYNHDNS